MAEELDTVLFESTQEFEAWLDTWHASSPGLWLKLVKKGTGVSSLGYADALDVALCFGWIDGQKRACDATYWLQRFTRRGPRSRWSRINRDRVGELTAAGRMRPAGLAEVDRARTDGRWDAAYEGSRLARVPDDLAAALAGDPAAEAFFDALDRGNRYAVLYRIEEAKRPATRAARIEKYVAMCARGEKPHP